ncbi:TetR/AcrR family transcriptional regulator [Celeribacter sp.]|uniref:TetR/AcrR family transcriptional regulator n=1 Tax=Celeribacter sp. TaxID=1890673 RepID=UPI003A93BABC
MAKEPRKTQWKQDPDTVKADILRVAVEQFAAHGLTGARIDEIAKQTATSKRMIYYYFGDKEGLYRAALEMHYRQVREGEGQFVVSVTDPVQALRDLVEFSFDFHAENPNFVRLIAIENTHHGKYLEHSDVIRQLNQRAVDTVAEIYSKGVEEGVFRAGCVPVEVHWAISALCFYNVSNQHTFKLGFGARVHSPEGQKAIRRNVADMIVQSVMTPEALARDLASRGQ